MVAAADHGVVAEGVSAYPAEVTSQMVRNFLAGGAAINVLARRSGIRLVVVDAGVATPLPSHPDLREASVAQGTANMTHGPAMIRQQAETCIRTGIGLARELAADGVDLIGTGEMGIGNTTAASAITAVLSGVSPRETTGRGAGRSDAELAHKVAVVERALERNQPDPNDGLDVLAKVGGFEIGVLAGVMLGGAAARRLVVLDGFIAGAAALIAQALLPPPPSTSSPSTGRLRLATRSRSRSWAFSPCSISDCGLARAPAQRSPWTWSKPPPSASARWRPSTKPPSRARSPTSPPTPGATRDVAMNSLRLAIAFLTVLPVGRPQGASMGPARAWFPLVGLGLGGVLLGLDAAAREGLPPLVVGAVLVGALLILTRALHTDGFLDCCDGLFGAWTPAERLRILRDTHVGAFAVIGGAALLITKWSLLASTPDAARTGLLLLFPCLSRFGMLVAMDLFPYARAQGLGASFQEGRRRWQLLAGLLTAVVASGLLLGGGGLILLAAVLVVATALGWWMTRLLGGLTGDAYGAINEVGEVVALLLGIALIPVLTDAFQAPFW